MSTPAGWYPQPDGRQRYWDGELWTEHFAPGVPAEANALPLLKTEQVTGSGGRSFGKAATFGWGGLALAVLSGALSSGFSGAAIMLGMYALVVGLIALARGRVAWARLGSRAAGGVALGAALVLMTVGGLAAPASTPTGIDSTTTSSDALATTDAAAEAAAQAAAAETAAAEAAATEAAAAAEKAAAETAAQATADAAAAKALVDAAAAKAAADVTAARTARAAAAAKAAADVTAARTARAAAAAKAQAAAAARAPAPAPKPAPAPPPPPAPAPVQGVHPGAFCSPGGALGRTVKGTLMRCSTTAVDSRNRWRAA